MDLRELPAVPFARHPWEIARARFFVRVVKECLRGSGRARILDAGAGDGYLASELVRALPTGSSVVCLDPHYSEDQLTELARRSGGALRFTRSLSDERFDLLLLLDVIEHVPDDADFVSRLASAHLDSGGGALISVPAWQALFTRHDVVLGHYRRYRPRQLDAVLARAGLQRLDGGSLFATLLLPRLATKCAELARGMRSAADGAPPEHATTSTATFRGGRYLSAAATWVLDRDASAARALSRRGVALPGLSAWVLGRKP
jgi:2-polyprenyl-3-methyl-5-hydroxy-6-metoxy-1,4-benzoquinol methylase